LKTSTKQKTKLKIYMVPAGKDLCLCSFESKGGAMQMLKQFQSANGISDDKSKGIAEWAGKAEILIN
jgi:hypothetical protein